MPRAAIYIDGQNQWRKRIDLMKLAERLTPGDEIVQISFYETKPISIEQLTRTPDLLLRYPFFNVRKESRRQLIDIQLSVDIVSDAYENKFDVAVLVAGDADYLPAVNKVQALGKKVKVAATRATAAQDLLVAVDDYEWLEPILPYVK